MKNRLVAFIRPTSFLDVKIDLFGYELEHGTHNGYVAVPPENKYHGKSWDEMEDFYVHGGVTFSEPAICPNEMHGRKVNEKYVGKKNPILMDAEFITENTEIGDDWWIFGFDTAHCGDNKHNWNRQAVVDETLSMMEQLNKDDTND